MKSIIPHKVSISKTFGPFPSGNTFEKSLIIEVLSLKESVSF